MNRGIPTVRSGSQIVTAGSSFGWKMIFFLWVLEFVSTPARPTSDPVPAVVGTAMEHAMANGLPKDEWLVYEDALRRGKTVLIALPNDEAQAAAAREVLGDSVARPALS